MIFLIECRALTSRWVWCILTQWLLKDDFLWACGLWVYGLSPCFVNKQPLFCFYFTKGNIFIEPHISQHLQNRTPHHEKLCPPTVWLIMLLFVILPPASLWVVLFFKIPYLSLIKLSDSMCGSYLDAVADGVLSVLPHLQQHWRRERRWQHKVQKGHVTVGY